MIAGNDVESNWLLQASWLSLLHDVDERKSNTPIQHYDVGHWHIPAAFYTLQRSTR